MDDTFNSELFAFDSPLEQPSYIKVIGVGGGGNNAVNHMYRKGIKGVDFIVSNTDMKALNGSPVPNKFVLGRDGLGAGGRPERARKAAEEKSEEIKALFANNTKMVFITAGMGGGTGTGAAPVIARLAKEIKLEAIDEDDPAQILVVAVVTTPFMFEGNRRLQQAQAGVDELAKYVDSILVINNEKLRAYGDLCMTDAFAMANDVLLTAVKSIAEIITLNAYVTIDFRDVNTVMEHSGTAIMGIGQGKGENRARQAIEQAATSVLLNDSDIAGAKNVLLYFAYGPSHEVTMDEMGEITDYITQHTGTPDTNIIWGMGVDENLDDEVKITLIATGFEQSAKPQPTVTILTADTPDAKLSTQNSQIKTPTSPIDEITIISRPQPAPTSQPSSIGTIPPPIDNYLGQPTTTPLSNSQADTLTNSQADTLTNSNRRVIDLYGDEPSNSPTTQDPLSSTHSSQLNTQNSEDEIHIISRPSTLTPQNSQLTTPTDAPVAVAETPAPEVQKPAPAPLTNSQANTLTKSPSSALDLETRSRAERIKQIHDLLRNNVNGAQIVEAMNPVELTGERLYQINHSSQPSHSHSYLDADGNIKKNPELFGTKD